MKWFKTIFPRNKEGKYMATGHELCLFGVNTHTRIGLMPTTAVNIASYFVVRDKGKSCRHTSAFFGPLQPDQRKVTEVVITPSEGLKDLRAGGQNTVGKTKRA